MIYTGATMDTVATIENQRGADVEIVIISLTPADPNLVKELALSADKGSLLADVAEDEKALYDTEEELLVAKFLQSTAAGYDRFTQEYEHSAYCTACLANAGDAPNNQGYRRRVQLTDNRHLMLVEQLAARDWAMQHAETCTALPEQAA